MAGHWALHALAGAATPPTLEEGLLFTPVKEPICAGPSLQSYTLSQALTA